MWRRTIKRERPPTGDSFLNRNFVDLTRAHHVGSGPQRVRGPDNAIVAQDRRRGPAVERARLGGQVDDGRAVPPENGLSPGARVRARQRRRPGTVRVAAAGRPVGRRQPVGAGHDHESARGRRL